MRREEGGGMVRGGEGRGERWGNGEEEEGESFKHFAVAIACRYSIAHYASFSPRYSLTFVALYTRC